MADFSDPVGPPTHVGVVDPDQDLNGDGVPDTVVVHPGSPMSEMLHGFLDEPSTAVVSDFDGDGIADHITAFEDDGGYSAWQLVSGDDAGWTVTDRGSL
ncbi:hypothetical protein GCM10007304_04190 [Rhodococcoides trifolii]|uniref:DUF6802 domain-containing protein n=1 Tax=Rhodococcoides trifolii TaxID=908250 RepID=A0A917CNT6_9NOCA|nr:DUF6802 family protein [Rhodococcus trifolii]GGF93465.1 hypothetical protein GCM10007304_04190 [Rhodococcus trifolii]